MARYTINYLTGETESITADKVNVDDVAQIYVFHTGDALKGEPIALVPQANVLSIHRQDDEAVTG